MTDSSLIDLEVKETLKVCFKKDLIDFFLSFRFSFQFVLYFHLEQGEKVLHPRSSRVLYSKHLF